MNRKTKFIIVRFVALLTVYVIIRFTLQYLFKDLSVLYIRIISFVLATILVPKINAYENQLGKQIQLKWIFWNKPKNL